MYFCKVGPSRLYLAVLYSTVVHDCTDCTSSWSFAVTCVCGGCIIFTMVSCDCHVNNGGKIEHPREARAAGLREARSALGLCTVTVSVAVRLRSSELYNTKQEDEI